ncbi:MAG: peptidase dimerization domain-containing protein [Wenzhouxiangellaceae bacterium]
MVLVASQIVVSLQSVVSRTIAPQQAGVITVGAIHGGSKHNIIGDRVEMQLTVRSNDFEVRETLLDAIDRVARGVAISLGVPDNLLPEVTRSETETTPPTINDNATAERVRTVVAEAFGEHVLWEEPREGMGAEDFAYFVTPRQRRKRRVLQRRRNASGKPRRRGLAPLAVLSHRAGTGDHHGHRNHGPRRDRLVRKRRRQCWYVGLATRNPTCFIRKSGFPQRSWKPGETTICVNLRNLRFPGFPVSAQLSQLRNQGNGSAFAPFFVSFVVIGFQL